MGAVNLKPSRAHLVIKSEMPNHVGVEVTLEKGTACAVSSDGACLDLPGPVFEALSRVFGARRLTAKITVEARNGGATGVKFEENLKDQYRGCQ